MTDVLPDVLKTGAHEDKGQIARLQYFVGAIAVGDLVKGTLGPRGMDKILHGLTPEGKPSSKVTVTNDGATILKSVWLDNPAAKILVDMSMQQDALCGDGTTGVVVMASELLRQAEQIVEMKVHPQIICEGYRKAAAAARQKLTEISFDYSADPDQFRKILLNVARTTISSKLLVHEQEHFAELAVEAAIRTKKQPNPLELIQIIKKTGGTMKDSFLEDGFILEKSIGVGQRKFMKDCKVMVANTPMDTDKVKIYGARVHVDSFEAVQAIELAEKQKMKNKVNRILSHGCNVFINRQLIYNYPDQLFKDADTIAIEHSDFDGMERLARALGADICSTFGEGQEIKLGYCKSLDEIMIGEDKLLKFSGCEQGEACSIILRGASSHVLDEAERSLHDALAVLSQMVKDCRAVYGGGAAEMAMAHAVDQVALKEEGKMSLAIEAFAKALRQVPTIILENGGLDAMSIVSNLRAQHNKGNHQVGIDINNGCCGNMSELGVMESYKSKYSQLCSAAEAAEMIVRVDDIIRCAPRERSAR